MDRRPCPSRAREKRSSACIVTGGLDVAVEEFPAASIATTSKAYVVEGRSPPTCASVVRVIGTVLPESLTT